MFVLFPILTLACAVGMSLNVLIGELVLLLLREVVVILLLVAVVLVVMYSAREVVEIDSFVPQKMCCCWCLICLANSFEKNSFLMPKRIRYIST